MLHWNSWWTPGDPAQPPRDGSAWPTPPNGFAAWTPMGWLDWQWQMHERLWQGSLALWGLYGLNLPSFPWAPGEMPMGGFGAGARSPDSNGVVRGRVPTR